MKYLSPFETYRIYSSLKLHFTSDYDAMKYNFKTNVSMKSFDKRKDKYHFAKIGRNCPTETHAMAYIVSNLVDDPNKWIGKFNEECHRSRVGRIEGLEYFFEKDCQFLSRNGSLLKTLVGADGDLPYIIEALHKKDVMPETVAILENLTHFTDKIELPESLWYDTKMKIQKYEPFIPYDRGLFSKIAKKFSK